jgi:hypothetical protein
VIGREEEERDQQAGQRRGIADHDHAPGLVVGREELVVEEAMDQMTDQNFELSLRTAVYGRFGLGVEGEHRRLR